MAINLQHDLYPHTDFVSHNSSDCLYYKPQRFLSIFIPSVLIQDFSCLYNVYLFPYGVKSLTFSIPCTFCYTSPQPQPTHAFRYLNTNSNNLQHTGGVCTVMMGFGLQYISNKAKMQILNVHLAEELLQNLHMVFGLSNFNVTLLWWEYTWNILWKHHTKTFGIGKLRHKKPKGQTMFR